MRGSDSITGMTKSEYSRQCGCATQSYQGNIGITESTPRNSNHRCIVKYPEGTEHIVNESRLDCFS